jgi:hypothetical protein
VIQFNIAGPPRTKKTSQNIVTIRMKNGKTFHKVMPSDAYQAWFKEAMSQLPLILQHIRKQGCALPIVGPVRVQAIFYRKQLSGDLLGFEQALADWLQVPLQRNGKTTRQGAGIILDDSAIESWDGSRKSKDALRPRIEVEIQPYEGQLFDEDL